MVWSLIIKALFEALTEYLKLRSKTFYADLYHQSYAKQDEYVKDVEKLRASRTPSDVERIDVLLSRLQQERARLNDLSTFLTKTNTKPSN